MTRSDARPPLRGFPPSHALRLSVAALLMAVSGCGPDGIRTIPPEEEPRHQVLDARLVSPHGHEGAVVLEMSAERVAEIRAADRIFRTVVRTEGGRRQVALIRIVPGALRFQVVATEGAAPPELRVLQVADGDDALRESLDGYRVELSP